MKVKSIIWLVQYSQALLIFSFLFIGSALVSRSGDGAILVLEFCIGAGGLILFFFRSIVVTRAINKSAYPGVAYSVMEKLGLTQRLDLSLSDGLLNEIFKPAYPTTEFLTNNGLKTHFFTEGIEFREDGFVTKEKTIPWKAIYDWTYQAGGRGTQTSIIISYYGANQDIYNLKIPAVGSNGIDLLLLLTHFKGKYGQQQQA